VIIVEIKSGEGVDDRISCLVDTIDSIKFFCVLYILKSSLEGFLVKLVMLLLPC